MSIFFAFFIQNTDKDKEAAEFLEDDYIELGDNEEYLHSINKSPFLYRLQNRVNRLNDGKLVWACNQRLKEIQMRSIIREIFSYFCFLTMIYLAAYSNINSNAFLQVQHLRNFFLNSKEDFTRISAVNEYWTGLENSFVSSIRAQEWYSGDAPRNLSGFINDKSNRLIGWTMMRQLRIKTDLFSTPISSICKSDYSFSNEEKSSFDLGWINQTRTISNSSSARAFMYRSGDELDTNIDVGEDATYNSGGYVYEYRGPLSDLRIIRSVC